VARPTFRLGNVLRMRRLEEDFARARTGEAAREARRADAAAEAELDALRARLGTRRGGDGRAFVAERDQDERHAVAVRAAWTAAASAHALHRQRQAALVEASQRVAALEKLEERVRHQRQAQAIEAEARELDDIVTSRRPAEAPDQGSPARRGDGEDQEAP